jgi:transcriptional regulator with XRE-family HTH domain
MGCKMEYCENFGKNLKFLIKHGYLRLTEKTTRFHFVAKKLSISENALSKLCDGKVKNYQPELLLNLEKLFGAGITDLFTHDLDSASYRYKERGFARKSKSGSYSRPLSGDFAVYIYRKYEEILEEEFRNSELLSQFSLVDGEFKNVNSYSQILVNRILRKEGFRLSRQSDLEKQRSVDINSFENSHKFSSSFVLLSVDSPNKQEARNLYNQIKQKKKPTLPVVIPFSECDLKYNKYNKNSNKILIQLLENPIYFHNSMLKEEGFFSSKDIDETTGMILRIDRKEGYRISHGTRSIYNRWKGAVDSGLRAYTMDNRHIHLESNIEGFHSPKRIMISSD